jgi:hypothetical protein
MDRLRDLLEAVRKQGLARGNFRGLLHVLIGRRLSTAQGEVISAGLSWRDAAALLKRLRWDREAVRELGLDPATLPPRDRQKYWYSAIAQADVGAAAAAAGADLLREPLQALGLVVGPGPQPVADKEPPKNSPREERPPGRKGAKG